MEEKMEHDGGAGNLTPGGAVGTRNLTPDGVGGGAHSLAQDSRNCVHNLTPDGTGSSLTPEQEKIVDDCEDIWGQVQQLFHAVREHRQQTVVPSSGEESNTEALQAIYLAKINKLNAEIKAFKSKPLQVLTTDQGLLTELLKDELTKSVSELHQTLSLTNSHLQEMKEEVERESAWLDQHNQIHEALQEKLQTPGEDPEQRAHGRMIQELKSQEQKLSNIHKKLMKKMASFVHKHFPPPTQDVADGWKGEHYPEASADDSLASYDNYFSLQTILEDLMNRCLEVPHDPFVTLTSNHWPPYIELLLRCHIAMRHPDGHLRIRLTPFHL